MALVHRLGQRIGDVGAHADQGGLVDAELHRDGVGGLKPDATDITRQAIGILRHDLHGIAAVGLVNANRARRADTMAVQEDHDLADRLLLDPGGRDAAGSYRTDAVHLSQAIRLRLDDIEYLVAEGAQELLGVDGPMPRIIPEARYFSIPSAEVGAEVWRNRALNCWPWVRSLTQLPVAVTHSPGEIAGCRDPLAGRDRGGMADQGDQLTLATGP
jgi:hypothetical protein